MNLTKKSITTSSGTGSATTRLDGLIFGVLIQYHPNAPATTTVTIREVEGAKRQLAQVAENNTDYHFVPQIPGVGTDNTPVSTYSVLPVSGERLSIAVTNGGSLEDAVTVWFWSE
ncbi:MAG: hypothetical protein OHK0046_32180 [Anaerolineae bacterium]